MRTLQRPPALKLKHKKSRLIVGFFNEEVVNDLLVVHIHSDCCIWTIDKLHIRHWSFVTGAKTAL